MPDWLEYAASIQGWMPREALVWLHDQAQDRDIVVEIGTWKGRSTAALAAASPWRVYTVDHFRGSPGELATYHQEAVNGDIRAIAEQTLDRFDNVRILTGDSVEQARLFRARPRHIIDMLFLDGAHDEASVYADLEAWTPLCRPGGMALICGHDRDWPGVEAALRRFGKPWAPGPGTLWYLTP